MNNVMRTRQVTSRFIHLLRHLAWDGGLIVNMTRLIPTGGKLMKSSSTGGDNALSLPLPHFPVHLPWEEDKASPPHYGSCLLQAERFNEVIINSVLFAYSWMTHRGSLGGDVFQEHLAVKEVPTFSN